MPTKTPVGLVSKSSKNPEILYVPAAGAVHLTMESVDRAGCIQSTSFGRTTVPKLRVVLVLLIPTRGTADAAPGAICQHDVAEGTPEVSASQGVRKLVKGVKASPVVPEP